MNSKIGTLYIVATPIGNLGDLSQRARDTLSQVSLILAEDTRHGGKLLSHYGISTKTRSFHEHNEKQQSGKIIELLESGKDVALISDAGTPLISDPGFSLVRAARALGIPVSPIPGPSALLAALSVSGLAVDRFCFEGFLPAKTSQRKERLTSLASEQRTMVFYESSHRITACLEDMMQCLGGERQVVVCRELTKKFESFYAGSFEQVVNQIGAAQNHQKGEFVVVVSGSEDPATDTSSAETLLLMLIDELPIKKACEIVSTYSGINKNELYQRALRLKKEQT